MEVSVAGFQGFIGDVSLLIGALVGMYAGAFFVADRLVNNGGGDRKRSGGQQEGPRRPSPSGR